METPVLQKEIDDLQNQIVPYANGNSRIKSSTFSFSNFSFDSIISSKKVYIAISIIVFFLLLFLRPSFLIEEKPDKKGNIQQNLSLKKLLQFWMIISAILVVGLFTYNYKKQ